MQVSFRRHRRLRLIGLGPAGARRHDARRRSARAGARGHSVPRRARLARGAVQRRLRRDAEAARDPRADLQNPILYAVEKRINEKAGNKIVTVHVIALPVARDELIPRLLAGQGDIAAAALTVTHDRQKLVDFSVPFASDVREVLVTGADAPPLASLDDLAGREVYLRESSSYAEHIRKLNERFKVEGKKPVTILAAPEVLEDGDILEMVNARLVAATVVDSFMADLYLQVFPNLRRHEGIASPPVSIAWAFRKNSPKLAEAVGAFVRTHAQGTLAGNVLIHKYLKTTQWVKNARSDEERKRFESMIELFKKYGKQYDLDSLLMAAQGYQESALDQTKRSRVGAIGVMQVMPATARDKAVGIPDIEKLDSNIHAGIKYNRWVVDNFYSDPAISPSDRQLFAFASYNAGPGRVAGLRREAKAQGLDPQQVVQQRRAGGRQAHRPRNGHLRQQHL